MGKSIGVIGCGNMGGAIISALSKNGSFDVVVYDKFAEAMKKIADTNNVKAAESADEAAACDFVILAVKPNIILSLVEEIKNSISDKTTVISIAAGVTLEMLENAFKKPVKLVRVMPNTPALVNEGMSGISGNSVISDNELSEVLEIFNIFGRAEIVPEKLMDIVTGVSGSSPAYVFMLIEAMADSAVLGGMPRNQAYIFAAQAVLGSAKMVLETGLHPGVLKDMVCSPGGTTIEAVRVLEKNGFRSAIIEAIDACAKRSEELKK